MALGSDKFWDWHVTQSWPMRHEKSAGKVLGLLAPKKETQGKFPFLPLAPLGLTVVLGPATAILLPV